MSKAVGTGITISLIVFFAFFIKKISYFLGLFMGLFANGLNVFSYVGVSCSVIKTFSYYVMVAGLFFVLVKVYRSFNSSS